MVKELNKQNFSETIKSQTPVLVDFWAGWCGPCRMLSPTVEALSEEYDGKLTVGKVNVDEQGELAAEFAIVSIPTVMLFKDGKQIEKFVGVHDADDYRDKIDELI